jgi:hypothetical protein
VGEQATTNDSARVRKNGSGLKSPPVSKEAFRMPSSAHPASLQVHPQTPAPMIRSLDADVLRSSEGSLVLTYRLFGDMARLRFPEAAPGTRCDGLWEHTCFEVFIARTGQDDYREFNFSPAGQWAAYDFVATRQPLGFLPPLPPPRITTQRTEGRLELRVELAPDALPEGYARAELELGLSAVIESLDTIDDARSYWALAHPCARPDFHHRGSFVLTLRPPL